MTGHLKGSRTLPRVRELKHYLCSIKDEGHRRTLPRVRELKLTPTKRLELLEKVAPFPGCVN